jgi:phosphatidylserine/phosphatidylglycerophosphate/cardiolipin synthase-like enzyme
MKKIILITILLIPTICSANTFASDSSYQVCFTPSQNCTAQIVKAIKNAQKTILVQAYSFTSRPIIRALVKEKYQGINIKILLDKSLITDADQYYSPIPYFQKHNIWMRIDYLPDIAHNKVIIIDNNTLITGSFNFTKSAQKYNAENVLIIHDKRLVQKYTDNWYKRSAQSISVAEATVKLAK